MNRFLLIIIKTFYPLIRKWNVHTDQLEIILDAKLKMDGRRPSMFNQRYNKGNAKGQDWLSMALFFFFGLMFLALFAAINDKVSAFVLYFSGWMVVLAMTLISDFTEVLIDPRDNYILLPRPVNDSTITVARVLHILLYVSKLSFAFALPGFIFVAIYFGIPYLPVFVLQVLISIVLTIFLVNLVYLILLRVVPTKYFKEAINYFQIAFTILIFGVYYLLPRIVEKSVVENINVMDTPITWILPPVWIGALWATLAEWQISPKSLGLGLLALTSPILALYAISTYFARDFNQRMFSISQGGSGNSDKPKKVKTSGKSALSTWLALKLTSNRIEKAAFEWTWKMMQRSRDFKLRVYPSIALVPYFFVYIVLQGDGTVAERLSQMREGHQYVILIYLCLVLLTTPLNMLSYSGQSDAAWMFYAHPVNRPGTIMLGAFKAMTLLFFFPAYLFMFFVALSLWGPQVLDDFMFGGVNILLIGIFVASFQSKRLPFSASWEIQKKGDGFVIGLMTMVLAGFLGSLHYFLLIDKALIIIGLSILSALLFLVMMRNYRQTPWSKLNY